MDGVGEEEVSRRRCAASECRREVAVWPWSTLEVISTLAGGSSAHARPSVGLQSGQASLRSLVLPRSPARRLESSLNGGPSEHKWTQACLTRTPGPEPNLASGAGRAAARDSPSRSLPRLLLRDWAWRRFRKLNIYIFKFQKLSWGKGDSAWILWRAGFHRLVSVARIHTA